MVATSAPHAAYLLVAGDLGEFGADEAGGRGHAPDVHVHVRVELAVVVPVVVALVGVVVVRVVVPGVLLGRLGLDVGVGQRLEQGSDLEDRRAVGLGAVSACRPSSRPRPLATTSLARVRWATWRDETEKSWGSSPGPISVEDAPAQGVMSPTTDPSCVVVAMGRAPWIRTAVRLTRRR